jgi:Gpi18-like mannosyltransferase
LRWPRVCRHEAGAKPLIVKGGRLPRSTSQRLLFLVLVGLISLLVRIPLLNFESGDYQDFLLPWYEFIRNNGGFSALSEPFSNYNAPYLYLLLGLTYLPVPPLLAIKLGSISFEIVLGYFVYKIVKIRYPRSWTPDLVTALVLLLPTVTINSAMWAQADAIYAAFAVGGVYFMCRAKWGFAALLIGVAVAIKAQAVFLLPVLLVAVLKGVAPWRILGIVPSVYLLLDLPATIAGADLRRLLLIYLEQAGTYQQLSLNAPNLYEFFGFLEAWSSAKMWGLGCAALVTAAAVILASRSPAELNSSQVVLAASSSVLLLPFILPGMHERYFYLADVLTVVAASFFPRELWMAPVLTQLGSFFFISSFSCWEQTRGLATVGRLSRPSGTCGGGFGRTVAEPETYFPRIPSTCPAEPPFR